MSVESFEAEVFACHWHARKVNARPFKQRYFFGRQSGGHVFSPELVVPGIFLEIEKLLS